MAKLFQLYENRFVCRDVDICASTMLKPLCTPRNRKSLCATKYHLETIRNHANRAVKLFPFQQQSSKYHNGSRSISPSRPNFETILSKSYVATCDSIGIPNFLHLASELTNLERPNRSKKISNSTTCSTKLQLHATVRVINISFFTGLMENYGP